MDRKPVGRVVIEIFDDVHVGGQRFVDLAIGKEGVRYQNTKFIRLLPVIIHFYNQNHDCLELCREWRGACSIHCRQSRFSDRWW